MIVHDVRDEIRRALESIPTLTGRSYAFNIGKPTAPASIVELPERVQFDGGYARGMDKIVVPITVLVAKLTDQGADEELERYLDGSGPHSVKRAVDGYPYASCDSVTVTDAEPAVVSFGSVQYLSALFSSDVVGKGA